MEVRSSYVPRPYFLPFHNRALRYAFMVCHRGAGKTVASVNEIVTRATYSKFPLARYAYVAPLRNQAKGVAWDYVKTFADPLIGYKSESDLTVRFRHNDAGITLYGADNPDSMRGLHFNGIVVDEYADMNPTVWTKILFPAIQARNGWVVFIGTPKGHNHFFKLFQRARNSSKWFNFILPVSQSGVLTQEVLDEARENMTPDEYDQEYECSFEAAVTGTYYSKLLSVLEANRHISSLVDWDPAFPVQVAMDIGRTDSASAWFWQPRPDGIAIIDYEEQNGTGPIEWFRILEERGYEYEKIWLPHDARAKTFATDRSTLEQFLHAGFPVDIVPRLAVQHGIDAARKLLPMCHFNPRCMPGFEALRAYRRKYNPETKSFSNDPLHDWSSHGSDAFRYLSLQAKPSIIAPPEPTQEEIMRGRQIKVEPWTLDELFAEHDDRRKRAA